MASLYYIEIDLELYYLKEILLEHSHSWAIQSVDCDWNIEKTFRIKIIFTVLLKVSSWLSRLDSMMSTWSKEGTVKYVFLFSLKPVKLNIDWARVLHTLLLSRVDLKHKLNRFYCQPQTI